MTTDYDELPETHSPGQIADLLRDSDRALAESRAEVEQVREAYENRTRDWYAQSDAYDQLRARAERLAEALRDIRWRVADTREMLMSEGIVGGGRLYGCDEWSTPTVNLQLAVDKIDAALNLEPTP